MKLLLFILLVCPVSIAFTRENGDLLDKTTSDFHASKSFDETIHQIEEKSGFKVSCSKEILVFIHGNFWWLGLAPSKMDTSKVKPENITIREVLDAVCRELFLKWSFEPKTNEITLHLAWETDDMRTPAELLNEVGRSWRDDHESDDTWHTAFNALLSKKVNINKAWRVRQGSCFQDIRTLNRKPVLVRSFYSVSGQRNILVLTCQPIRTIPGHGSVSFYWFKEDGTLVGAELMNTGNRTEFLDATINKGAGSRDPYSTLHMVLKCQDVEFMIATLSMGDNELTIMKLMDENGKETYCQGFGKSLLYPEKP